MRGPPLHPRSEPLMPLMRAWGSGTQPADAHDALPLGGLWGVSGAIPFAQKIAVHRRHGGVGGTECASHKASLLPTGVARDETGPLAMTTRAMALPDWLPPLHPKPPFGGGWLGAPLQKFQKDSGIVHSTIL